MTAQRIRVPQIPPYASIYCSACWECRCRRFFRHSSPNNGYRNQRRLLSVTHSYHEFGLGAQLGKLRSESIPIASRGIGFNRWKEFRLVRLLRMSLAKIFVSFVQGAKQRPRLQSSLLVGLAERYSRMPVTPSLALDFNEDERLEIRNKTSA